MKNLKEIIKKTDRLPFSKDDTDFFGKYLMIVDKLNVAKMRPDISLKDEKIIDTYDETFKLGIFVWQDLISNMSFAFVKNKKKNKQTKKMNIVYSLFVKDYEEDNSIWKDEGSYLTFLGATNWLSKAFSATEPRIFEALKIAGLDK